MQIFLTYNYNLTVIMRHKQAMQNQRRRSLHIGKTHEENLGHAWSEFGGRKSIRLFLPPKPRAVKPRARAMITTSHIKCKVVNGEAAASVATTGRGVPGLDIRKYGMQSVEPFDKDKWRSYCG